MNEMSAAAGTNNQRQRATPATATPASPAGNANQPPRPTRRRRSRRRRGRSASTDTGASSPAAQPVVAAPPTKPATTGQPAAPRALTWDPEVELTADLRDVPTDKLATRIRHVLDQVSREVTLIVWIHDRPDATPVLPVIYQELRAAGYYSDTTRLPQGGQRMRISRRRWRQAAAPPSQDNSTEQAPPAASP